MKKQTLTKILAVLLLLSMLFTTSCGVIPKGNDDDTGAGSQNVAQTPSGDQTVDVNTNENEQTTEKTSNKQGEIKDEDGNLLVPFDVAYPELFASGDIEYADDTLLLKMPSSFTGDLTAELRDCGFSAVSMFMSTQSGDWYRAKIDERTTISSAAAAARAQSGILMVDYDYIYRTEDVVVEEDSTINSEIDGNDKDKDNNPDDGNNGYGNDDKYKDVMDEVSGNVELGKQLVIGEHKVKDAWLFLKEHGIDQGGSSSVIVAVIDTGVDYTHPDLIANMWINTAEIPNNGIDDDGNGYVDDIYGCSTIGADKDHTGDPMDDHGHGTHVAGIIGASNNKEGIVGIAYNTKIMAVKAGQATGVFNQSDIAEAIIYAYQMGADVINMSFGGTACSIPVQDALMSAYTTASLVASAGNDGALNELSPFARPSYPAALSYVIGVMSVDTNGVESSFTNWDVKAYTAVEYEVYALGESVVSTLPGGRYGALSGTSMAAPVVSATAALLRSYYSDRDMYPSKFIAAQISATSESDAICYNPDLHGPHNLPMILDIYEAFTKMPKPDVNLYDYTILDTVGKNEKNNGDGVADAGEIIDVGVILRNRWGMSENTIVSIDTLSMAGIPNPYVEIINGTIDFDGVGTYSTKSNYIYDEDNIITGFETPITVKIKENCPNDYLIQLYVTITYENALDKEDKTVYTNAGVIEFWVRSGIILPSQITEDMTLTKDNYYIIPNSTYIAPGVTVTVEPGTQIQFWGDDSLEPYALTYMAKLNVAGTFITQGTEDDPVLLFPSEVMSRYRVEINEVENGTVKLNYTTVTNPYIDITIADHCTFNQNYQGYIYYRYLSNGVVNRSASGPNIKTVTAKNSLFYKLGGRMNEHEGSQNVDIYGLFDTCAFVDSQINFLYRVSSYDPESIYENCVFNGNYATSLDGVTDVSSITLSQKYLPAVARIVRDNETGTSYIIMARRTGGGYATDYDIMRGFAKSLGGELVCIETEKEHEFLSNNFKGYDIFVGYDLATEKWYNGEDVADFWEIVEENDNYGYARIPHLYLGTSKKIYLNSSQYNGSNVKYIIEIPGSIYCDNIQLQSDKAEIDLESKYQLNASVIPATFDKSQLIYVSEDEGVATVDKNGLITPVSIGTTRVFAYAPDYKIYDVIEVSVVEKVPLKNIEIDSSLTIQKGETTNLNASLVPANTTEFMLNYASSDSGVVSVDNSGNITANSVGTATVTISGANGISAQIEITVISKVKSISFADKFYVTYVGDTDTSWKPIVNPSDATDVKISYLSSNPEVAYVDENGNLVRVAAGIATLRAYIDGTDFLAEIFISVSEETLDEASVAQMSYNGICCTVTAVTDTNDLYIWGKGYIKVPKKILSNVKAAYVGGSYSSYLSIYVLDTSGTVTRYNYYYQSGTLKDPTTIIDGGVKELSADSGNNYCALKGDGSVWVWGSNSYGQLGIGNTTGVNDSAPVQVEISNVKDIKAYNHSAIILCENGDLYLCGGQNTRYLLPQKIDSGVTEIRASRYYGIYEKADETQYTISDYGTVYQHTNGGKVYNGYNTHYSLYIKNGAIYVDCVKKFDITNAVEIFAVIDTSLYYIKTSDGKLYGVGYNANYQLADLTMTNRSEPTRIFFGLNIDENPLTLENVNVEENKLNDNSIVLDFNAGLIIDSSYASITLKDENGKAVSISKEILLDKFTVTPYAELENGKTYTLTIPAGAVINFVGAKNEAMTFTFTYENLRNIELANSSIKDGDVFDEQEIKFALDYTIAVKGEKFDEIKISKNGEAVNGVFITLNGDTLEISGTLDYGDYVLTVPAGAIRDNVGGVNGEFVASFKIANVIKLTGASINDGQTRVDENADLVFTYTEAYVGENYEKITLLGENGNTVEISVALENNVLTISHETLEQGEKYVLTIPNGALCDALGNQNKEIVCTFTTYSPIELLYASLVNTSTNMAINPHFVIKYNGDFVLDQSLIKIVDASGNEIAVSVEKQGNTLVISAEGLLENTQYTLVVNEGALTDERGVKSSKVEYNFTTVDQTDNFYWTIENVAELRDKWVAEGENTNVVNSAILNNYNITDVEDWLRFIAGTRKTDSSYMPSIGLAGNYWGTDNYEFIEKRIITDFDDFNELSDIVLGEILTEAPENTFPFVVDAYLLNSRGERTNIVGNETVTFVVEFNRDMDTSVDLRVRFGSSLPYAEYEIKGEYVTARRWEGTYTLKTTIENGRQYINVENARAADDHYLIINEPDFPRFGFELDTTAAQAMIMTGEATETGIKLTWMQDDFMTLLGYNVYRSTKEDGNYIRLNSHVLPFGEEEFFDSTVEPGVRYYYNFTVVQTDLTESTPSGKISIMSLDTMAPNIYHSPVRTAYTGSNLIVAATITDNLGIKSAKLYYRTVGSSEWRSVEMLKNNQRYSGIINADYISLDGLEYYIEAYDGVSYTYNGSANEAYSVTVKLAVDKNSLGDVDGDGIITNKDALMLLQASKDLLNLTEEQFMRADIDGNGELTASEALRILQYVSGKVTTIVG